MPQIEVVAIHRQAGMHHTTYRVVNLVPLPCWGDLPAEQYRERIAELVEAIIAKAAARRAETGIEPLGRATYPPTAPVLSAGQDQEIARAVGPRRQQEDPNRGQDRLRLVRKGFSRSGGVSAGRRSAGPVSPRLFSSRSAVCPIGSVGDRTGPGSGPSGPESEPSGPESGPPGPGSVPCGPGSRSSGPGLSHPDLGLERRDQGSSRPDVIRAVRTWVWSVGTAVRAVRIWAATAGISVRAVGPRVAAAGAGLRIARTAVSGCLGAGLPARPAVCPSRLAGDQPGNVGRTCRLNR